MSSHEIPLSVVAAVRELTRQDDLVAGLIQLVGAEPKTCANENCGREFLIQTGRSRRQSRTVGARYCSRGCGHVVSRSRRWLAGRAFDTRMLSDRPHLVALGDSHIPVLRDAGRLLGWPVSIRQVPGATAQGLRNPDSKTNALPLFEARCARAKRWQHLVFLLGEVDCGFVIWYRAEKHGVTIESQVQRSLSGYIELVAKQVARGYQCAVLSVPLPTIQDGQDWGEIAYARTEVTASLRDRTKLTLEYNARLSAACDQTGTAFVDVTTPTLDQQTGVILDSYRHPDPTDHHLNPEAYAALVASGLPVALPGATLEVSQFPNRSLIPARVRQHQMRSDRTRN